MLYAGIARLGTVLPLDRRPAQSAPQARRLMEPVAAWYVGSVLHRHPRRRRMALPAVSPLRPAPVTATAMLGRSVSTASTPSGSGSAAPMARRCRAWPDAPRRRPFCSMPLPAFVCRPLPLPRPPAGVLVDFERQAAAAAPPLPAGQPSGAGQAGRTAHPVSAQRCPARHRARRQPAGRRAVEGQRCRCSAYGVGQRRAGAAAGWRFAVLQT